MNTLADRIRNNRGIAIPMTLLLLTVLTVMLSSLFLRVSADRRMAASSEATITALTLAQSGLQSYMNSVTARPTDGDSVRINLNGGYAEVVARVLQQPLDTMMPQTFIIRSTGYVIVPSLGSVPLAVRTVAEFAVWQSGGVRTLGAFTGTRISTLASALDDLWVYGADRCGMSAAIPGIRSQNGTSFSDFNPDMTPRDVVELSTTNAVGLATGIRWAEIVGGGFTPDHTTLASMPPGDTTFQSYLIDEIEYDAVNIRGSGLLIITGELDTGNTGSDLIFEWDGIVLIGDDLDADALDSTVIRGLLVTGLNTLLAMTPDANVLANAPVYVYYDSCNIAKAMERFKGFVPIPNAWVDNWAMY
ncbi:MAG: hypothetical protein O7I93_08590 [Gemmatimonadetes bacterium]|nr:hypothetical protein [Gemmatimonadota bacterium]